MVEVDDKFCMFVKQQLNCFLIWEYEFIPYSRHRRHEHLCYMYSLLCKSDHLTGKYSQMEYSTAQSVRFECGAVLGLVNLHVSLLVNLL